MYIYYIFREFLLKKTFVTGPVTKGDESDESLATPKSGLFGVTRDNARASGKGGGFPVDLHMGSMGTVSGSISPMQF